jgi:hypothetical protein
MEEALASGQEFEREECIRAAEIVVVGLNLSASR